MSSFYEISTDKLGKRAVVRGGGLTSPAPKPFYSSLGSGQIFEDDVNGFSSSSDIFFLVQNDGERAETLRGRQATRHDCLPSLLGDGDKLSEIVSGKGKKIFCTGPRQNKRVFLWGGGGGGAKQKGTNMSQLCKERKI